VAPAVANMLVSPGPSGPLEWVDHRRRRRLLLLAQSGTLSPAAGRVGGRRRGSSAKRQDTSTSSLTSHMSTVARVPGVSAASIALNA
jgi:hypothetical protein